MELKTELGLYVQSTFWSTTIWVLKVVKKWELSFDEVNLVNSDCSVFDKSKVSCLSCIYSSDLREIEN